MKTLLCAVALAFILAVGAAEADASARKLVKGKVNYTSEGFNLVVSPNGVIKNLTYKDISISPSISFLVNYNAQESGFEAHDSRIFQLSNYTSKEFSVETKDGSTIYTVDSEAGNQTVKNVISYRTVVICSPEKVTVKNTVKLNCDLTLTRIRGLFQLPADIVGKGLKSIGENGMEKLFVIPRDFSKNPKYGWGVRSKTLMVAVGGGSTFSVNRGDNCSVLLEDERRWGGERQSFEILVKLPESAKVEKALKGSEYSWSFDVTANQK